jgi:hypothetical protein
MKATDWLPLFDGTSLAKWAFDGGENLELDGDTLVLTEHPKGKWEGLKAEVGGASWDNYIFLEPTEKQLQEYEQDASYNWLRHKEAEKLAQAGSR